MSQHSPAAEQALRLGATERLAMNLRAYAWSRGAEPKEDDEQAALDAARMVLRALEAYR